MRQLFTISLISLPLAGCFGLETPDMHEPYQTSYDQFDKENTILAQVKCELQDGIQSTLNEYSKKGKCFGYGADWIKTWAAKINLKITAQETGNLNPSFSYNDLPGIFTFGASLQGKADATRAETIGLTWSVQEILAIDFPKPCRRVGNYQIESDLKIKDFILRKAFLARIPGNISYSKLSSPYDVFNYEVIFITTYGGNVNPVWKFKQVGIDPSSTLFDTSRIKTDDLTITMGPAEKDEFGGYRLKEDAEDVRRASLIGQAIRSRSISFDVRRF